MFIIVERIILGAMAGRKNISSYENGVICSTSFMQIDEIYKQSLSPGRMYRQRRPGQKVGGEILGCSSQIAGIGSVGNTDIVFGSPCPPKKPRRDLMANCTCD